LQQFNSPYISYFTTSVDDIMFQSLLFSSFLKYANDRYLIISFDWSLIILKNDFVEIELYLSNVYF